MVRDKEVPNGNNHFWPLFLTRYDLLLREALRLRVVWLNTAQSNGMDFADSFIFYCIGELEG